MMLEAVFYRAGLRPCHPERGYAESKDLGTNFTANEEQTQRFFDYVLRTPLRMTDLVVWSKYLPN